MGDSAGALLFCGVIAVLLVLFAAGLRLRAPLAGPLRLLVSGGVAGAAGAVTLLANVALSRHYLRFDLTRERAFTPSAEARQIVHSLHQPVRLTYFYQKQDPA